ncbi:YigZ family protein [Heliobacillus mobilis]|uniref:YigZ family protein n=1 Tax=Heliobacterium mobile TaxID=28064 RepID=A0A6I3SJA1_HELMO|nr:YigZ family protein [Heliobacterium mobile]MTV48991.1 YigZ family protein [Heliobacterium mobile]
MLEIYQTVKEYGETELEISKSRFLIYTNRAETVEEAIEFIGRIKKKHWDATHNCSAYVIGEKDEHQKADDDGEPSGTAGKPILEVIKKMGIKDTVIVVTRYFGGIKLGAGGLIRAYGKGATLGLKAAGIVERRLHTRMAIEIDYTFYGAVENELRSLGYRIDETRFTDKVTVVALEINGLEGNLEKKVNDWTSGQASIAQEGVLYVDTPLDF